MNAQPAINIKARAVEYMAKEFPVNCQESFCLQQSLPLSPKSWVLFLRFKKKQKQNLWLKYTQCGVPLNRMGGAPKCGVMIGRGGGVGVGEASGTGSERIHPRQNKGDRSLLNILQGSSGEG